MLKQAFGFCFALVGGIAALGCSSDGGGEGSNNNNLDTDGGTGGSGDGSSGAGDFIGELEATGVLDYLGDYTPSMETPVGDTTEYWFDVTPDGPQCIDGSAFGLSTRDQGSDNLIIYLAGGGACWEGFMACTTNLAGSVALPAIGGMNPAEAENPMKDWNHAFVPYCDGSIFVGDIEQPDGRIHHGLKNLSAALDTIKADFPNATRVMLAGSSAGGFGTIWGTGLVRKLYPDAELFVFNDSGAGIAKDDDPAFNTFLQEQWGATGFIPESCTECQTSAHVIPLVAWGLERDPNIVTAVFSAYEDSVIADVFLGYAMDRSKFTEPLLAETGKIHDRFPDRYRRFFIEGGQHTTLGSWGVTMRDGITVRDWATAMLDGDLDVWKDMP